MAVFYNSSAQIQSANFTNVSAASLVTGTIQSAQSAAINVSAVTGANTTGALMSNLIFSNVGGQGITFGLATAAGAGTLTASAAGGGGGVTMSHYDNMPLIDALVTTSLSTSGATNVFLQPFQLPAGISIGWVRLLASFSRPGSASFATSNGVFTYSAVSSWWINIYSLGTGASSESLVSYATTSGAHTYFARASMAGTTGTSVRQEVSWSYYNRTQATQISWSTVLTTASFNFSQNATAFDNLSGLRFLDIPFATSLPAGNYWFGINNSFSTATNTANMTGVSISQNSLYCVTQVASTLREMGNTTQRGIVQALGSVNITTIGASVSINAISPIASNPKIPFQLLRQA